MALLTCGFAGERPGDWTGNYPPCERHAEVLKRDHMTLGIRFSTVDRGLAEAFARAMNFWTTVLDMNWYQENTRLCAVQILDGNRSLFRASEAARAQFPDRPAFQGWIAFNPHAGLNEGEQYQIAVHELGHLLGLAHNPNSSSVMYFLRLDGPVFLDAADLSALATRHKLRASLDKPLAINAPGE